MADVADTLLVVFDEPSKHLFQQSFVFAPTKEMPNNIGNLVYKQNEDIDTKEAQEVLGTNNYRVHNAN